MNSQIQYFCQFTPVCVRQHLFVYFYIVLADGIMLVGHGAVSYIIAAPGRV